MKRTFSLVFCLVLLIVLSSCSNSNNEDVQFFPELVRYNLHRSDSANEFSFNMSVISSQKNPEIEFISAKGVNTEHLIVTFSDDTFDDLSNKKIKGNYIILLGVHCEAINEYTRIDSMTLSVNGAETEIEFVNPVENTAFKFEDSEHFISQLGMPVYVFPQSFVGRNETNYDFTVEALKKTTIKSFNFNSFLEFVDTRVFINDKHIGKLDDILPLTLNKGDILRINCKIKDKNKNSTGMENSYANILVECESDKKTVVEYFPLSATFIGSINDAEEFVNHFFDK